MPDFNFDLTLLERQIALAAVILMCAVAAIAGWRSRKSRARSRNRTG